MTRHVLVIGGGVAGLATAWELARAGTSVTVCERRQPGQESSWAGAGILSALLPWNYGHAVNRLINASLARYPRWIDELCLNAQTDPEYRRTGMLILPPFDADAADRWLNEHALGLHGVPRKLVDVVPEAMDGLWLDHVAQVRNPRLVRALREACEASGVAILDMREANGLKISGDVVTGVVAGGQILSADDYVLATGAWSTQFLGKLARGLQVRPCVDRYFSIRPSPIPCPVSSTRTEAISCHAPTA